MHTLAAVLAALTLAMTGAMTGVFFAFSVSVTLGLDAAGPERAVPVMQRVNERILNPVFLTTFVGAPLTAAVCGGLLLAVGHTAAGWVLLAAAGTYALGAIVPTAVVNVPLNNALNAAGTPESPSHAARLWGDFAPRWTAWNTARAVASCVSLLLVGLGVFLWGAGR
ncbi:anthrone oxygenase family protein [Streptomyces sp. 4N509B]|uniref:anthrone oxygenase family protein n=1 Tax=Streptomyces sp. 4N509B TaxID=3457413 RepID=UPI003FD2708C